MCSCSVVCPLRVVIYVCVVPVFIGRYFHRYVLWFVGCFWIMFNCCVYHLTAVCALSFADCMLCVHCCLVFVCTCVS